MEESRGHRIAFKRNAFRLESVSSGAVPTQHAFLLISLARSVTIKTLRCYSTIFHGIPRYSAPYSTRRVVRCLRSVLVKLRSDWRSFFDSNRLSFVQIREVSSDRIESNRSFAHTSQIVWLEAGLNIRAYEGNMIARLFIVYIRL